MGRVRQDFKLVLQMIQNLVDDISVLLLRGHLP
jgi:hypothetical protein